MRPPRGGFLILKKEILLVSVLKKYLKGRCFQVADARVGQQQKEL